MQTNTAGIPSTDDYVVSSKYFRIKQKIYRYIYGYNIKYNDFPSAGKRFESKVA